MIFAHSVEKKPQDFWETLEKHSKRVATAAEARAEPFGGGKLAHTLGLLHDLGKAKPEFQQRIRGAKNSVTHSGEGAKALLKLNPQAKFLAGAIAGHHGRLPNPDRLEERLQAAAEIPLPDWCRPPPFRLLDRTISDMDHAPFRLQFLARMLYGALCEADDRQTAGFFAETEGKDIPSYPDGIHVSMQDDFDQYIRKFSPEGKVNALRGRVLTHVRDQVSLAPGLFTLTVPTGGGKTLASLGFALDHALAHGLHRLVFVIPYMSIVEQTADVFREVLGDQAVLEHHSSVDWSRDDETEAEQLKVMGTGWNVPVIVTTAVQFFESLYAARKKRCRKLPSLARSVIVLDEAQTLPLHVLRPCLAALWELMQGYGSSVVLSTATQPSLTAESGFPAPEALEGAREIAPDPLGLFRELKRVRAYDIGIQEDKDLCKRIRREDRILVIVDNRMQARSLFDSIRDSEGAAHLSTLMTPAHRRAVLAEIRERLSMEKTPVRLISTSLVEAGVDIDFPLVLRAATGIDSISQAAGRCNREGKLSSPGRVEIFRSQHDSPPAVEQFAKIGQCVIGDFPDDPIGKDAVDAYFRLLWDTYGKNALDSVMVGDTGVQGILRVIHTSGIRCPYEDIEKAFRIVREGQKAVIVRDGEWGVDVSELDAVRFKGSGAVNEKVKHYTVNVPWSMWKYLWNGGHLSWWMRERFDEQFAVLDSGDLYDDRAGLNSGDVTGGVI